MSANSPKGQREMLLAIILVAAVLLVLWSVRNQRSFEGDYLYQGSFQGNRYECIVGGLYSEDRMLCMTGADRSGIYFLPHPKPQRLFQNSGRAVFRKSLFIPWQDMTYCSKKVLFRDCLWFDLSPRKIWIYVPREIGEKLLTDGHREVPAAGAD